jgi:hypothetical protein
VAAPSRVAEQRVQEWLHGVPDVVAAF